MPTLSPAAVLDRTLSQLMKRRQEYVAGLAEIDGLFSRFGISLGLNVGAGSHAVIKRGPGRPRKETTGPTQPVQRRRRRRGSFKQTAEEFVLSVVPASTSEINKAWKGAGRGGTADNALTALVKKKLLKRTRNTEGRGSTYAKA